jgi:hypothetical protein
MYKKIPKIETFESNCIIRTSDGASIPMNPDNTDYQQYLKWVEEGNTPLPADGETSGEAAKGAA